jgi:hypothetical protein
MSRNELSHCCATWMDRRSRRLRCGGLMVIIGLLWLAQRADWMPTGYLGPMVLLVIGFWFLVTSRLFKTDDTLTPQK